ncbi:hypothetical protein ZIOFF_046947 [Zingiber officinale]|uniref:Uncharacterized protein n=1 Tax=Zingiber officinale TaxID=94328 RepID=A0A8J5FS87_ZINOF|nr:hypothetical protein ZIOFF_046947 [Zingiber officinale]
MSVRPVLTLDTHGNLDEQIAQLMQCKPLAEQEVTSRPFPRLFSSDHSFDLFLLWSGCLFWGVSTRFMRILYRSEVEGVFSNLQICDVVMTCDLAEMFVSSDYWDLLSSAFGTNRRLHLDSRLSSAFSTNSKGSPKETLTILLRRVAMSSFVAVDLGRLLLALSATQRNPRPDSPSFGSASKSLISFSSSFRGAPSTSAEVGARNGHAPVLAAGTKHLMGSLSKTEGLKFAVVRVLCEKTKEVLMEESNVQVDITSFKTIPVRSLVDTGQSIEISTLRSIWIQPTVQSVQSSQKS